VTKTKTLKTTFRLAVILLIFWPSWAYAAGAETNIPLGVSFVALVSAALAYGAHKQQSKHQGEEIKELKGTIKELTAKLDTMKTLESGIAAMSTAIVAAIDANSNHVTSTTDRESKKNETQEARIRQNELTLTQLAVITKSMEALEHRMNAQTASMDAMMVKMERVVATLNAMSRGPGPIGPGDGFGG